MTVVDMGKEMEIVNYSIYTVRFNRCHDLKLYPVYTSACKRASPSWLGFYGACKHGPIRAEPCRVVPAQLVPRLHEHLYAGQPVLTWVSLVCNRLVIT